MPNLQAKHLQKNVYQDWLKRFCDSFFALATRFDTVLIGGDTTKGDLVFNVSPRCLFKAAAAKPNRPDTQISSPTSAASRRRARPIGTSLINYSVRNRVFHWVRHCCRLPMPRKMFQTAWLKMWGIFYQYCRQPLLARQNVFQFRQRRHTIGKYFRSDSSGSGTKWRTGCPNW
jgi:hypothetical protein